MSVERSLEAFFAEHPSGPFFVYTFATSGQGLTKLHKLAPERHVTLLLRDASEAIRGRTESSTWRDGRAFLNRDDVAIKRLASAWSTDEARELVILCDPEGPASASFRALANLSVAGMAENLVGDREIRVESPAAGELVRLWNRHCDATSDQKHAALSTLDALLGESGGDPERERALGSDHQTHRSDPFAVRDEPPPPPSAPTRTQPSRGASPRPDAEGERPNTSARTETGTEASQADDPDGPPPPSEPQGRWQPQPPPPPPPPPPRRPRDRESKGPRRWVRTTVIVLVAIFAFLMILAQFSETSDEPSPQPTTTSAATSTTTTTAEDNCHPAYVSMDENWCVPDLPDGEDLECSDVPDSAKPIQVLEGFNDRYNFDGDGNGWGCERPTQAPTPTTATSAPPPTSSPPSNCHSAYEARDGWCVPVLPAGGDLECGDVPESAKPIRLVNPANDPYNFDGDGDGWGCGRPPSGADQQESTSSTEATTTPTTAPSPDLDCHPAYEGYCVPILPDGEDFQCSEVPDDQRPFTVIDPSVDPYNLDGPDPDNVACELPRS